MGFEKVENSGLGGEVRLSDVIKHKGYFDVLKFNAKQ